MKRILSFFLVTVLAAALLVCPAAAAGSAPGVRVDAGAVTVQGLSGQWNGLQLTLKLNKAPSEGSFTFDPALSEDHIYTVCKADGNDLTLYVTSRTILGTDGALRLGALAAEGGFTVQGVSDLRLAKVGANLEDAGSVTYENVSLNGGGNTGGSSGGNTGGGGGGSATRHGVKADTVDGGALKISTTNAARGETVTVTATPHAGYRLGSLAVTDSAGNQVPVTDLGDGKWSFTMPAGAVTVTASFVSDQPAGLPFQDVGDNDWYREAVEYVYSAGLMNGTDQDRFSPNSTTTRGMVVTLLHRYEGAPEAGSSGFLDVPAGAYYEAAVNWAAGSGVVNGISSTQFAPDREITREQMAAIFYRYAQKKGVDVSGSADLSAYHDGDEVSAYAVDAVAWAVRTGIITGIDTATLLPHGPATRAQVATILMRFCTYLENQ